MHKTLLLCLASALVGAAASAFYEALPVTGGANAQEARPIPFPRVDATTASRRPVPAAPGPRQPQDDLTPEERVNVAVYENVNRSVVNISTKVMRGESFFFSESPQEGAGSGSVVDGRGHILTNYHVV